MTKIRIKPKFIKRIFTETNILAAMTLNISIPALLFPAISLTMLAYNARYLAIAALIRQLHKEYITNHSESIGTQINQLRKRLYLIRNMQATAILSFLGAVITMGLLYTNNNNAANIIFGLSLIALVISLSISLTEVYQSTTSLNTQLNSIEEKEE